MIGKIIVFLTASLAIFTLFWLSAFSSPGDPHNVFYWMWRAGICRLSSERIYAGMVTDNDRDRIVIGKTRSELEAMFGALVGVNDAPEQLRETYERSDHVGREVAFLRGSSWMVVFERGRVVDLVLIKG